MKKKYIPITFIFTIISLLTDKIIFDFDNINIINYIICKILYVLIIFLIIKMIYKLIKEKNKKYFISFLIYFIPLIIILIICWPGFWTGSDVYNFLRINTTADILYYLNYMSSIFNIISYMFVPVPSAPIIMQIFLLSIVISYIHVYLYEKYKTKLTYLVYVPFFLPITIMYVLYPNRPIVYGILYLLLIGILVIDLKEKNKLTTSKYILVAVLGGILTSLRSEGIYLIIVLPILLMIIYKKKFNTQNIVKYCLPIILIIIGFMLPQKIYDYSLDETERVSRSLPSIINPLSYMITQDLKGSNIDDKLEKIGKVLDIEKMKKYNSLLDVPALWEEDGCVKDFTMKEFKEFKTAYYSLVLDNIFLYIKCKTYTFYNASGLGKSYFTSYDLYNDNDDKILGYNSTKVIFDYKIRKNALLLIEGRNEKNEVVNKFYRIFNNLLIPFLLAFILLINSFIKKNYKYSLLLLCLFIHIGIVYIMAPASYFMYYFPVYLSGYVIFIIEFIKYKKGKKNEKV